MFKLTRISLLLLLLLLFVKAASAEEFITYSHLSDDGYWQVWMVTPDGNKPHQITYSKQDKREPMGVNQGQGIAYRTNNGELFFVNADSREERQILKKFRNIQNPHFSDATQELVFVRFDPREMDRGDIWKSDILGERSIILTKEKGIVYQPVFSSQGDQIAFVRADEDRRGHQLWVMRADGSEPRQLTKGEGFHTLPDFSPDGKWITFTSNMDGHDYEIYLLEIATGQIQQLTNDPGLDTSSCFSPDGAKIAFVSNRSGHKQIWVMGKDGTNLKQITFGQAESIEPAWIKTLEEGN